MAKTPEGKETFIVKDPWNNYFQVVEDDYVFIDQKCLSGGTVGAMIGVTDIERAFSVYRDVLGYDTVVYDETGVFADFAFMNGGDQKYRRVLLRSSRKPKGAFAELMGNSSSYAWTLPTCRNFVSSANRRASRLRLTAVPTTSVSIWAKQADISPTSKTPTEH